MGLKHASATLGVKGAREMQAEYTRYIAKIAQDLGRLVGKLIKNNEPVLTNREVTDMVATIGAHQTLIDDLELDIDWMLDTEADARAEAQAEREEEYEDEEEPEHDGLF